jgi:MSHA biogenesis protein MshI
MKWFRSAKREPGWLVIAIEPERLRYVQSRPAAPGKSLIARCGTSAIDAARGGAERVAKELHCNRYQCATVLRPDEYRVLQVEAPNVPQAELKSAIRWRIKDMVDYLVDDATIDLLDIPPEDGSGGGRGHLMYAVAARNEVIQARIKEFENARIPLSVIDIPETAQRNIAALYESEERGVPLLMFGDAFGLLTINFRSELYLARRMEIGLEQIRASTGTAREGTLNRILVELQRTFDHFERQYRFISVNRFLLGPEPQDTGLLDFLSANLGLRVERVDLTEKLAVEGEALSRPSDQWELFYLIGASLRSESRVL